MISEFIWTNISNVNESVIKPFDSGNQRYNDWLIEKALTWQSNGEMVTYVAVNKSEYDNDSVSKIYAYASISATGLMMLDDNNEVEYLSCCEIRLFAIHRGLRGVLDENFVPYSVGLFKSFLQDLWQLSTTEIGFKALFLNSNSDGLHLYTDETVGFMKPEGYVTPTRESELDISGCTPLLFFLDENGIYKMFE